MKLSHLARAHSRRTPRRTTFILPEYTRRPQRCRFRAGVLVAGLGLVLFGLVYGATFTLVAPYLIVPLLVPLVLALALAIWVLPESRTAPAGVLTALLFAYVAALFLWPNYLAISLPGTPWITIGRLIGAPMSLLLLYAVSTARPFREAISSSSSAAIPVYFAFLLFLLTQCFSIFLSSTISNSLNKFINAQFGWTATLYVSMYVFRIPENRRKIAQIIWASSVIVAAIGIWEWRARHILWAGHLPSFLHIDEAQIENYLRGGQRAYTNIYRPQSTASTSLGFAELLALSAPFAFYFLSTMEKTYVRVLAAASLFVIFMGIYVSDARSGLIGFSLTVLTYGFATGLNMWRTRKNSLVGIAVSLSYPAVMVAAVIASFMFHAIRVKIWGGGAQAGSTEARVTQMHMGLPLIAKNPLGYGMGKGASVLNFRLPGGMVTIDNYYLSLALEFGVLGLAAFLAFIGLSMYLSAKHVLTSKLPSSDNRFYLAIFQSLLAFFVIKSVLSQQDNHPIIFMVVGLLLALLSQEPDISEAIARRRRAARK